MTNRSSNNHNPRSKGNDIVPNTRPKVKQTKKKQLATSNQRGRSSHLPSPPIRRESSSKALTREIVPESPGLKAWEEASKNFDGYGMQLFDLLDQIDEGVHSVIEVDAQSAASRGNNNNASSSSSFQNMLDNSDLWM